MMSIFTFTATFLLTRPASAQSPQELYRQKNYQELIRLDAKPGGLSAEELYMVGFAFFQLSNDGKAVEYYDKATAKGLNTGYVHFYKGLALAMQKDYDAAFSENEIALRSEPENQEYMNQKGLIFRYRGQVDSALNYFKKAVKLTNTFGEPFYWIANIYHGKEDFNKALGLYYVALDSLPKSSSFYLETLKNIGQLEFTHTKQYGKSAQAYASAIRIDEGNYRLYAKLMKALNAAGEYSRADSVFLVVKQAFELGKLPRKEMDMRSVDIAQFDWNGQTGVITRSLIVPTSALEISYKILLLNQDGNKVERRFVVEKTIPISDDVNYLLCEEDRKTGRHITYPYSWPNDVIPAGELEKAVKLVLNKKLKMGAASESGE